MANVFLSYSRSDLALAQRLAHSIERQGWSVWWDSKIRSGEQFRKRIQTELDQSKCALVLWSKAAVSSDFVLDEASIAFNQNKMIPVTLDGTKPPLGFNQLQTLDLSKWALGNKDDLPSELLRELDKFFSSISAKDRVDSLSLDGLIRAEHAGLAQVWIYAPKSIELGIDDWQARLRQRVFRNMLSGVNYTYFVDSLDGASRIEILLKQMARDFGGTDRTTELRTLMKRTTVVVLDPDNFMTHYCIHHHRDGRIDVFQDEIHENDDHVMIRLNTAHAAHVLGILRRHIGHASRLNRRRMKVLIRNSAP